MLQKVSSNASSNQTEEVQMHKSFLQSFNMKRHGYVGLKNARNAHCSLCSLANYQSNSMIINRNMKRLANRELAKITNRRHGHGGNCIINPTEYQYEDDSLGNQFSDLKADFISTHPQSNLTIG